MDKSLYRYVLKHSLKGQIVLLVITAISMPFIYVSLEVPKIIINEAIGGQNVPEELFGYEIDQVIYLLILSAIFLGLVLVNGGFKYFINVYRGALGERVLRRLRYELYSNLLRFPLPHFKRTSQGETIAAITAVTEPISGFSQEAYSLPAFQGGMLLTYLFFIFNQDPWLGAAATALYPFQLYIIPKLQKRVNRLMSELVESKNQLANRIGQSFDGVSEIHANDTSHYQRADVAGRLGGIYALRYDIYKKKFFIKFLNNFLGQLTPFFFYSAGGYFVIRGELSLGALVAVLAAYKDLASPWRELINFYARQSATRTIYGKIIGQFQPANMLDQDLLAQTPETVDSLGGTLLASNVTFSEDEVVKLVDGVNLQIELKHHVAIVGGTGTGKDELGRLLARLLMPKSGRITIADADIAELPEAIVGRRIGYVGQSVYLFPGSVRDNLYYSLKHVPTREATYTGDELKQRQRELAEARATGCTEFDWNADWIDYTAAGVADREELEERACELLGVVLLGEDVYQLGLRSTINPEEHQDLVPRIMRARKLLQERLREADLSALVEPFDETRYNENASVAENLLFGNARDIALDLDRLAKDSFMLKTLGDCELLDDLYEIGRRIAETMVDLFADLPPGHEFFEQFSFIGADELKKYQPLLARIDSQGLQSLEAADKARLLTLSFKLVPARHRLGLITDEIRTKVLKAREEIRSHLPDEMREFVSFFSADEYNAGSTLLDNILFGKRAYGQAHGQARLNELIGTVVAELDLRDPIQRVGLGYDVGVAGGRLSLEQRQKLALARALLKRPDILIVNDATNVMDGAEELRVALGVLEQMKGRAVVWISARADLASNFDAVMVISGGRIVERGTPTELAERDGPFKDMLA